MFRSIVFKWIFFGVSFSFLLLNLLIIFLSLFFYMGYNKYPEKEEWTYCPA